MGELHEGAPVIRNYTNYVSFFLKHSGSILATLSLIAVLIGFGLIWIYLQIIGMPDLFFPVLTSNPVTPIAITLLSLIAGSMAILLLFLPAIVVWVSEAMFKIELTAREKVALFLCQISILFVYVSFFSTKDNWLGLLVLIVCLLLISGLVGRGKRSTNDLPNLFGFIFISGIVGLYWVFGLMFLHNEIKAVNKVDDGLSAILALYLMMLALFPAMLQIILEKKTKMSGFFVAATVLLCCVFSVLVFAPHQTINAALGLAGIRQNSQDARYYLVDEKYKSSILDVPSAHVNSADSALNWNMFSDTNGLYILGYKIFQLSDVTVLCPKESLIKS